MEKLILFKVIKIYVFRCFNSGNGWFEQIVLEDSNSETRVEIFPECGALLHSFKIATNPGEVNVIENYKNKASFQKKLDQSYKRSKQSPFYLTNQSGKVYLRSNLKLNF